MTSNSIYNQVSCIECRKIFSSKGFHTHFQRIHDHSQTNYANQTEKATLGLIKKSKERKAAAELEYSKNPKICIQCGKKHSFESRNNKCCSSSCSATYKNINRDYSKFKPGPPKGTKPTNYFPYTKIKQCVVCEKYHPKNSKTCSTECLKKLLSKIQNARIDAGWNPQEHRNKSKPSYLERSFESWLIEINFKDYIKNKTFRCDKKIYYGDFYFPSKNLLIELDGNQHKETVEYDLIRDESILKYHGIVTYRISYKEFIEKTKIDTVLSLIND